MTGANSVEVLRAVGDTTRLEIVDRIAAGTQVTVTTLADVLPMTRQAVTRHVRTLEEAGVVVGARTGREHRYRVDVTTVERAGAWLQERGRHWDQALMRLAAYVESDRGHS